ncbi:MAG: hypothetical protein GX593_13765, partial [Actinomycetales bacterium]|nr:hypothetical protein [Actinomycetales bacterium]
MRSDGGLPADRRVTPEALEGYRAELAARVPPAPSAPRAPGPLRARDIVWGTTVAYLTMP